MIVSVVVSGICFFFFQAEDGIRDAQESRGLGDVYKRQVVELRGENIDRRGPDTGKILVDARRLGHVGQMHPVSYTHLTLPTIYSV